VPHSKAEHMAAPTNAANVQESPCQLGAVHTWHKQKSAGALQMSANDPKRTSVVHCEPIVGAGFCRYQCTRLSR
jgi:hypothetical protein